jgi:hypothetical protein
MGNEIDMTLKAGMTAKEIKSEESRIKWRQDHPDYTKLRRATHYDHVLGLERKRQLKTKYNLTQIQFDTLMLVQCGKCAICQVILDLEPGKITTPHIDHDHTTQAVRDLLCRQCNLGLGNFRDDADTLRAAISYMEGK